MFWLSLVTFACGFVCGFLGGWLIGRLATLHAKIRLRRRRRVDLDWLAYEGEMLQRRLENARTSTALTPEGRRVVLARIQADMDRHGRAVDEVCR